MCCSNRATLRGLLAVTLICALASTLAIRVALKVDPAAAIEAEMAELGIRIEGACASATARATPRSMR